MFAKGKFAAPRVNVFYQGYIMFTQVKLVVLKTKWFWQVQIMYTSRTRRTFMSAGAI